MEGDEKIPMLLKFYFGEAAGRAQQVVSERLRQWSRAYDEWLAEQALAAENALNVRKLGVKRQVQVAAHVSAQVIRNSEGRWLRFSEHSAFAGKVLRLPGGGYPPRDRSKFLRWMPFFIESHLIAQPLR
jgi:hypothetical protein